MPYEETGAMVQRTVSSEAIEAIERADSDAIVQSMTSGAATEAYTYRFQISGKDVIGISATGADKMAKLMGNIEVLDVKLDKDSDPDYIYAMVRVKDLDRNVTLIGVGRQCKYIVGKRNEPDRTRIDEHAFVKAITKAQRNGILHHADEEAVAQIIKLAVTNKRDQRLAPPVVTINPSQPQQAKASTLAAQPHPTVTAEQLEAQKQRMERARLRIQNKIEIDLGKSAQYLKEFLTKKYGPGIEKLDQLSEAQLGEMDKIADAALAKKKAAAQAQSAPVAAKPVSAPVAPAPVVKPAEPVPAASTPATAPVAEVKVGSAPAVPVVAPVPAPAVPVVAPVPAHAVPVAVNPKELGFADEAEQKQLIQQFYYILSDKGKLGLTVDQSKKFINDRGFPNTKAMTKAAILSGIQESGEMSDSIHGIPVSQPPATEPAPTDEL